MLKNISNDNQITNGEVQRPSFLAGEVENPITPMYGNE